MATRKLILLRHGKSDWHSAAAADFERPLNGRGRRNAVQVGRWLHFYSIHPDVICCSSSMRTRQTLALVSTELNIADAEVNFIGDLYHATESEVIRIADEQLAHHQTVMLLGHNPGFELALMHYCPDVEVPADGKLMTTACVAVIALTPGEAAKLEHLKRPDEAFDL